MNKLIALLTLALAFSVSTLCGMPSAAAANPQFAASITVNGQKAATASAAEPIRLYPDASLDIMVEMVNRGTQPVNVRKVEFTGRVLMLKFYAYATPIDVTVLPGQTERVRYRLDLEGLRGQATGLIGATFVLRDNANNEVTSVSTVTDVQGSLMSVYGLFGIALLVMTSFALLDAVLALLRHRMSANRFQRGMRLLGPGIGIGMVLGFSASVLRLWVPSAELWTVVAGLTASTFFALGYFSPTPEDSEDEEFDEDEDEEEDDDLGFFNANTEDFTAHEPRR